MKRAKRPRGLAARFKQREIDEIRLSERRAKLERQAMIKGKPIDDYARDRGCTRPNCLQPGYHSRVCLARGKKRGP